MSKQCIKINKYIVIILIFLISLFSKNIVFAESITVGGQTYNYSTEDDGTDGPAVEGLEFELTIYGDNPQSQGLGSGYDVSKMHKNTEFGWMEYEENGVTYVVFAAATHEMLASNHGRTGKYWFYGAKFDHIHYFRYPEKFKFKFQDTSISSETYNGIVLDSGDFMMFPQAEIYNREKNKNNALDTYFGPTGESDPDPKNISGAKVLLSMDGTFAESAGEDMRSNFFIERLSAIFSTIGDAIQIGLTNTLSSSSKEVKQLTYSRSEIEKSFKDDIQVKNAGTKINTKTIKEHTISNKMDNKRGVTETIYSSSTPIPVIPVDIYSLSKIKENTEDTKEEKESTKKEDTKEEEKGVKADENLFDINFLNSKNKSKAWNIIRDFVVTSGRIVLYISAAALVSLLIWRGILLVRASMGDDPEEAAEAKTIIDNGVMSILLIVGVYLIITIMAQFYHNIANLILNGNNSDYLVRITVTDTYAFNTNIIGWVKYMSLSTNELACFGWSFVYLLIALANLFWFLCMCARTIIIAILIIIAPFTAVMTMLGRTERQSSVFNILHFRNWLNIYTVFVWTPLIIVIIYRIILHL